MTHPRPQTHVFIAVSVDGFIARPDGSLDWLMQAQAQAAAGEDFGYAAFMAEIDALLMGRKTFETVQAFDPWPYEGRRVHVLSRQADLAVPAALQDRVSVSGEPPAQLLQRWGREGLRRVYLDGGELVQSLLREDLIDAMTLTQIPILLGQGRRPWGALPADLGWRLEGVSHWPCGFVQTRYRRQRLSTNPQP